jgi:hypothetical protein
VNCLHELRRLIWFVGPELPDVGFDLYDVRHVDAPEVSEVAINFINPSDVLPDMLWLWGTGPLAVDDMAGASWWRGIGDLDFALERAAEFVDEPHWVSVGEWVLGWESRKW